MENENVVLVGGLTAAAAVVGAYVLWGPSVGGPRRRGGRLAGLVNLGQTCFLNTVLQALAACPVFIRWLEAEPLEERGEESLRTTLRTVLEVINGTHESITSESWSPDNVMTSLRALGWAIPSGEHDAHELLHVLLNSLQEQQEKALKSSANVTGGIGMASCLAPEPDTPLNDTPRSPFTPSPSPTKTDEDIMSGQASDNEGENQRRGSGFVKDGSANFSSEMGSLKRSSFYQDPSKGFNEPISKEIPQQTGIHRRGSGFEKENTPSDSSGTLAPMGSSSFSATRWRGSSSALSLVELAQESSGGRHRYGSSGSLFTPSLGVRGRALSRSSLSLAPGSIWGWAAGDAAPPPPVILPPQPPPFTGTLVSRLSCERCGRRSPLRTERFDSLTLPLPEPSWRRGVRQHVRLHDLLAKLTQPERVQGVRCESSQCEGNEREHVRHVQIGKAPPCLCLHVARASGPLNKRHEHVQFPARLTLAPYTYLHGTTGVATLTSGRNTMTLSARSEGGSPLSGAPGMLAAAALADWRHTYQLAAVVVHCGDTPGHGHYATYRRGHQMPTKWYFASDAEIREAHLDEVMASSAYMLFYEKCTNVLMH